MSLNPRKIKISNWGNYPVIETEYFQPNNINEVIDSVKNSNNVIARGNGRCYGDAALGERSLSMLKMNNALFFDKEQGVFECEAGMLLSDILDVIVPNGFFLPVTPGTKFISVGGALAADIHGKSHHKDGCFSNHVLFFDLVTEKGQLICCSRKENSELFWETIGGMGLTGVIVKVRFTLKKIETSYIYQESIKANNLEEIIEVFNESDQWTYTVAWLDCLAKGKNLGRSILMRGEHLTLEKLPDAYKENPLRKSSPPKFNIPFNFPSVCLNSLTMKVFNTMYFRKQVRKLKKSIIHFDPFFYPLDAINNWNRIYGKEGFTQYQFVLPIEKSYEGLKKALGLIAESGQGSFLTVLKLFGKNNPQAMNSFPIEGYTLALDFKINRKSKQLFKNLDKLVSELGGRVYFAKDAFSELPGYLKIKNHKNFDSLLNKRVGFKS